MSFWAILEGIFAFFKAIPQLLGLVEKINADHQTSKRDEKHAQNEEIRKEVENAKTTEDKQAALDKLAGRFGNK